MAGVRFLRTIRFDATDTFVFANAAEPDEWAVSGAFAFAELAQHEITGKLRQAFANGFLGLTSFGRATFACVGELGEGERAFLERRLAEHFVEQYGAPDIETARPAARDEIEFVAELVRDSAVNTIFAVHRAFDDDGRIREQFRRIEQRIKDGPICARAWEVEDEDG